jgi:uncharacterized repeat protein (TIGR03803 family)
MMLSGMPGVLQGVLFAPSLFEVARVRVQRLAGRPTMVVSILFSTFLGLAAAYAQAPSATNRAIGPPGGGGFIPPDSIDSPALVTLQSFSFNFGDGAYPYAGLVQASNGDIYGTTSNGGVYDNHGGTVFRIAPGSEPTTLYSFCSQGYPCPDGSGSSGALIQANNGSLYGTTSGGGLEYDTGTIFEITPSGVLTTLYKFCAQGGRCPDGAGPSAGLVQASDGNLYGTTYNGGAGDSGTVFRVSLGGALTTLYSFCSQPGCTDGQFPQAGLMQAKDGYLYGTTKADANGSDAGTVFRITLGGTLTTVYTFCSKGSTCPDGRSPYAGLVQASDGSLFGTTYYGGRVGAGTGALGYGTVFRIVPGGALTTVYRFCARSGCTDGANPYSGLIQASDGNLYGTTSFGGASGYGSVFKITSSGALTSLYSFCSQSGCTDGENPYAGLVQASNGDLYGTTVYGGTHSDGTVFELSVGLPPPTKTAGAR